jgi:hypothetical protein
MGCVCYIIDHESKAHMMCVWQDTVRDEDEVTGHYIVIAVVTHRLLLPMLVVCL